MSVMEESRIDTSKRIFICLSSKDRHDVAEAIAYNLANYGIAIWYDRHKMLLGEDRNYNNFIDGIVNTEYAVIIMSKNSIKSTCVEEEMVYLKEQYDIGQIKVFPIMYKISPIEIPQKYQWLCKLVYKELNENSGVLLTVNHIICKILKDEVSICSFKSLYEIQNYLMKNISNNFLLNLLNSYLDIDRNNHNARISLLYCMFLYSSNNIIIDIIPQHYWRTFERIFSYTKLDLQVDLRETIILEYALILIMNKFIEINNPY
jgi:hypothetical protein